MTRGIHAQAPTTRSPPRHVVNALQLQEEEVEWLVAESLAWLGTWPLPLRRAYARRLSAGADVETLVAVSRDGLLVGFCRLRHRRFVHESWLEDLYVVPRSRGDGIGGSLVSEAIAGARRHGFYLLKASIERPNLPARRLAEQNGFHEAREGPAGGTIFVVCPLDRISVS